MDRILILSFQAQSGKSTLALQLADCYRQQRPVVLMDYSSDQLACEQLEQRDPQAREQLRGVAAGRETHMLSKVWAEEVTDHEMVIVDTSQRIEHARLDYLLRQINSVLLLVDLRSADLLGFEQQFGELIKRIRMVRSRLVVIATHATGDQLQQVVQLRQALDHYQIPLVMKLEAAASEAQVDSLAQMLLNEEMRVDSVSGNRLGRALHAATVRAGSMVGAIETLTEIAQGVQQEIVGDLERLEADTTARNQVPSEASATLEQLQQKNRRLADENERLRRS